MNEAVCKQLFCEINALAYVQTVFAGRWISHGVVTGDDMARALDDFEARCEWAGDTVAVEMMRAVLKGSALPFPPGPPDWLRGVVEGGKPANGAP